MKTIIIRLVIFFIITGNFSCRRIDQFLPTQDSYKRYRDKSREKPNGIIISQQDQLLNSSLLKEKIICIAPEFNEFEDSNYESKYLTQSSKFNVKLEKEIKTWSKKFDFNYEVISMSEHNQLNDSLIKILTPIKFNLIAALEMQKSNVYNSLILPKENDKKEFYEKEIFLPQVWSEYAKMFNTRFFSTYLIYTNNYECFSAHIIGDVVSGKVIFHVFRIYKRRIYFKDDIATLVFDSFYTLKKRIK